MINDRPILTISMPIWGRPERTRRALSCLLEQTRNNFELIALGDACPQYEALLQTEFIRQFKDTMYERGNRVIMQNTMGHHGNCGYYQTNLAIQMAQGRYFCFYANDDMILPNHVKHYTEAMELNDVDFCAFETLVPPMGMIRKPVLKAGSIGHSELCIKTEFLRKMPPHKPAYGHDWSLVEHMIAAGGTYAEAFAPFPTYVVMSVPGKVEQGID